MRDLTRGPIDRHVVAMAAPVAVAMIVQTLYYFVDLYFVARLGDVSLAGVSSAGNATVLIMALTQVLGVGTVALIAPAVGRKDRAEANLIFNQSLVLSALLGLLTLIAGLTVSGLYTRAVAADALTAQAGATYLHWFAPGLALQFAMVAMSSALRGTGVVQPTMVVQVITLLLNVLLAPVFIAGWGTHHPMGVAGAGLASSISIAIGVVLLWIYFIRRVTYVSLRGDLWRPRMNEWRRILGLGLPAGGEFALMFVSTAVTYWTIRSFGAAAQAGFGVGSRVMQGIFVPALAIAFAAAPIAGQNFGAGNAARVRETFAKTALISSIAMALLTLVCQWNAEALVRFFASDPEVIGIGALFLRTISWIFVAQGLVFTCSNMFQGLGNTMPSLISSAMRLVTYALPAIWLSMQPFFRLHHVWYWSIATNLLQAVVSVLFMKQQLRMRLAALEGRETAMAGRVEAAARVV